jgi:hypothetical protein
MRIVIDGAAAPGGGRARQDDAWAAGTGSPGGDGRSSPAGEQPARRLVSSPVVDERAHPRRIRIGRRSGHMTIIGLPDNFIGKEDQLRLESFGGHLIARGYATRWHWVRQDDIDVAFELFSGGADQRRFARIIRDREHDRFVAHDAAGRTVAEGTLDHVMAVVDAMAADGDID